MHLGKIVFSSTFSQHKVIIFMTNTEQSTKHLVITSVGTDKPGIVNELAKACSEAKCNIIDSRMTVLGGEFAIIMMVSGAWNDIAKLEDSLPSLSDKLGLNTTTKHTTARPQSPALAYSVSVVALDNPGIVHEIARYFSDQSINIDDLNTGTYSAPHTGTQMFNLGMTIRVPADTHIASLRDDFMDFCDELNLDAIVEPLR